MSDHYETLGLQPNASKSDIRNAYVRLAHRYHPDHHAQADAAGRAAAAAWFRKAKDAYDVLSDEARRAEYDRINRPSSSSASGSRHGPYGGGASSSSTGRESSTSTDGEADWESSIFEDIESALEALRKAVEQDRYSSTDYFESYYEKKLRLLREEEQELRRKQRSWKQQGQGSSSRSGYGHAGRSSSTAWGQAQGGGPRSRPPPRPWPMASGTPLFLRCAALLGGSALVWCIYKRRAGKKATEIS